jgi:hypothetical protein
MQIKMERDKRFNEFISQLNADREFPGCTADSYKYTWDDMGRCWDAAQITDKISRSGAQNSLYWAWLTDMEKTNVNVFAGNDSEWWHKEMKYRYLCPIYIRDDIGYAEMIKVLHDIKDLDGYMQLRDGIIGLTSTTKCSVEQFSEYLGKIEKYCHDRGIMLRTDSRLYSLAMGDK